MATETKMTHTPGQWYVSSIDDVDAKQRQVFSVYAGDVPDMPGAVRTRIATEIGFPNSISHEKAKANARLIAAAPDLLEACRDIVNNWQGGDLAAAARQCSAAIAKATD